MHDGYLPLLQLKYLEAHAVRSVHFDEPAITLRSDHYRMEALKHPVWSTELVLSVKIACTLRSATKHRWGDESAKPQPTTVTEEQIRCFILETGVEVVWDFQGSSWFVEPLSDCNLRRQRAENIPLQPNSHQHCLVLINSRRVACSAGCAPPHRVFGPRLYDIPRGMRLTFGSSLL